MAATMDATMDIDIDLGDDDLEVDALHVPAIEPEQVARDSPIPEAYHDDSVPNKVHIHGVDDLSTADLEAFAAEHFPQSRAKVEWIDDSSANFTYEHVEDARKALTAFTSIEAGVPDTLNELQLRAAKSLSTHPETRLQVRTAVVTDRKKPRAREASRYYLLHPEEDPGERKRNHRSQRRRRKSDDEIETYDASMYDERPASPDSRQRRGSSSSAGLARSRRDTRDRYDRDRSASPGRAGSRSNFRRNRERGTNASKELFPSSVKAAKNKDAASRLKKDLFPSSNGVDTAADLFATKISVPLVDEAAGSEETGFPLRSDDLFKQQRNDEATGFSIRGSSSTTNAEQGFSIRGSAGQKKSIKELFPDKAGPNSGKELFGGRSARRNKAADLFG